MTDNNMKSFLYFVFLCSGFCSLLYQIVWIRIAYSEFGVTTPIMSVILSVFMLGLSIGSWFGGKWVISFSDRFKLPAIYFYAATEFIIGLGAFAVPKMFSKLSELLLVVGQMNSANYLVLSSLAITISLLPWCILMGGTFPIMMHFFKQIEETNTTSFSYLYYANVIGASLGTLISAVVLIELFGFKNTLMLSAVMNFLIAFLCILFAIFNNSMRGASFNYSACIVEQIGLSRKEDSIAEPYILFLTGLISMGMEVLWIRGFTPVLKTTTYSFASLLTVYLISTCIGSFFYRRDTKLKKCISIQKIITGLPAFSVLPLVLSDPRLNSGIPAVLLSIVFFCCALGYLTPMLIDRYSNGDPVKAGKAYAYNIIGCIIGPIVASYVLLPYLGVKQSIIALSAPQLIFLLIFYRKTIFDKDWSVILTTLSLCLFIHASTVNESYEEVSSSISGAELRRDYAASTISYGQGLDKHLLVNGIGMTTLSPITKVMAHLPLSYCKNVPMSALSICFGMGTTHRSFLSWDIRATAVELVPGVMEAFGFYHSDADNIINNPKGKMIVDDGRRFLRRVNEKYDVITIDPPPPIEAAGSSLLYSEEFYGLVKSRLKDGGIVHHWFPFGEKKILNAIARSLNDSFPYVHTYISVYGWGVHFICSNHPLKELTEEEMLKNMPEKAKQDLIEWNNIRPEVFVRAILSNRTKINDYLEESEGVRITDDKPYNEYFFIRRFFTKVNTNE